MVVRPGLTGVYRQRSMPTGDVYPGVALNLLPQLPINKEQEKEEVNTNNNHNSQTTNSVLLFKFQKWNTKLELLANKSDYNIIKSIIKCSNPNLK